MIESHPFAPFVPEGSERLILGTFPGKCSTRKGSAAPLDDWYYGSVRNQFWTIMAAVYGQRLTSKKDKMDLLTGQRIAMADIIASCERSHNRNSDGNLVRRVYNQQAIDSILARGAIRRVLFTGSGVKKDFLRHFSCSGAVELLVLPSPSPLYGRMSLEDKIAAYRQHLRG